jgi:hypothetical protein
VGLPRLTGFEDRLGHRARAAPEPNLAGPAAMEWADYQAGGSSGGRPSRAAPARNLPLSRTLALQCVEVDGDDPESMAVAGAHSIWTPTGSEFRS